MRKVLCILLVFPLTVSGCSPHLTAHCQNLSDDIATSKDERENYNPALTPITDVVGECYCSVEDAAIAIVVAPLIVAFAGICLVAVIAGPESAGFLWEQLEGCID